MKTGMRWLFAASLMLASFWAAAQGGADRPIRLVVPYPPGASTDMLSRHIAEGMSEALQQRVVVENRPGANSVIGISSVAKAAPDGYTLTVVETSFAVNPSLHANIPYALSDFAPVSLMGTAGLIWVVHPSVPADNAKALVDLLRAQPGKYNYGHAGTGNPTHLGPELLKAKVGLDIVSVAYKGSGPAVQDLVGGSISMMFTGISAVKSYVETGRLKAIAVTSKTRSSIMPDVPTMSEAGISIPELEQGTWWGIFAPAGTPKEVIDRLNDAVARAAQSPAIQQRLAALNIRPMHSTPQAFKDLVVSETAMYADLVKRANIKAQ